MGALPKPLLVSSGERQSAFLGVARSVRGLRWRERLDPASSNLATAIRTVVILVIAWGIVLGTGEVSDIHAMSTRTWVMLILSGVATGLSWLFYFRALQIGQASYVSPIDKSSTAMVLILSVLILGEQLTWQSLLGTLLIVAGTLVFLL